MISLVGNCSEENMAMACSSNDLPIEADDDSDMPELIETEAVLGLSLNEQKSDAELASSDAFVQVFFENLLDDFSRPLHFLFFIISEIASSSIIIF